MFVTLLSVLFSISVAGLLFCAFMLFRNYWVYGARIRVLETQRYSEFKKLPSYGVMLWKFWIWDVEKFKKEIHNV